MKIETGSIADLEKLQNVQLEKKIEKFGVEIDITPPPQSKNRSICKVIEEEVLRSLELLNIAKSSRKVFLLF